jgi:hypothetical protein
VWPGAWIASKVMPATATALPSLNSRTSSGSVKSVVRPVKRCSSSRVSSPMARSGSVTSTRSSGCTQQLEAYERHNGVTENM